MGCGDEDKKVQYEANCRLEASTVRGGMDGGGEQRCTKSTTHVGRADSDTEGAAACRARAAGEAAAKLKAQTRCLCAARCPMSRRESSRRQRRLRRRREQ